MLATIFIFWGWQILLLSHTVPVDKYYGSPARNRGNLSEIYKSLGHSLFTPCSLV